jgi:hypothetical protein
VRYTHIITEAELDERALSGNAEWTHMRCVEPYTIRSLLRKREDGRAICVENVELVIQPSLNHQNQSIEFKHYHI